MDKAETSMAEIVAETTKIAAAVDRVMRSYVEAGGSPAMIGVALCSEGAAIIAEQGTPQTARQMLAVIGDALVKHAPVSGLAEAALTASRPATMPEVMAATRSTIDLITSEFASVAKECASMIASDQSDKARNILLEFAATLSHSRTTH